MSRGSRENGLPRHRIDDVGDDADRRPGEERIEAGGVGVGHGEHVGFVNAHPAADRRPVEAEAFRERVLVQVFDGKRAVLPAAEHVHEFQVDHLGLVLLGEREEVVGRHRNTSRYLEKEGGRKRPANGKRDAASIADPSNPNAGGSKFVGSDKAGVGLVLQDVRGRDIIYPLCARPPSPEPKVVREPPFQLIGYIVCEKGPIVTWDLQHLPKPQKASVTGR